MRIELNTFTGEMYKKLLEKDEEYGDSWKHMNRGELLIRLREEWDEFSETVWMNDRDGPTRSAYDRDELIDIANLCMMLYIRGE